MPKNVPEIKVYECGGIEDWSLKRKEESLWVCGGVVAADPSMSKRGRGKAMYTVKGGLGPPKMCKSFL